MKDVTAAVIVQDEKVLITRRAVNEKHAGWWEFPGGKVEDGESPKACLKRELMEELGVEARIGGLLAESIYSYQTGQADQAATPPKNRPCERRRGRQTALEGRRSASPDGAG